MMTPTRRIAALALLAAASAPLAAQEIRYRVTDLGTLGGPLANAFSINQLGEAVGQSDIVTGDLVSTNAYRWRAGELLDLGALNDLGLGSVAVGINDQGQVVGAASAPHPQIPGQFVSRPFLWTEADGMIDIAPDPQATAAGVATAINDFGEIAGYVGRAAFRRSIDGSSLALPNLAVPPFPFQSGAEVEEINIQGEVVGRSVDAAGRWVPAAWSADGTIRALPAINPVNIGGAKGINDFGRIVGQARDAQGRIAPMLWTDDVPEPLGLLADPAYDQGTAEDINNLGVVVGWDASVSVPGTPIRGWVRYPDGRKIALNDLLIDPEGEWDIRVPLGINDVGQIVGVAVRTPVGGTEIPAVAFLLDPVPDPDCRYDLSRDGRIDDDDLFVFQGALGSQRSDADFDGDGWVSQRDLRAFLIGAATEDCSPVAAAAGEPSARRGLRGTPAAGPDLDR